MDAPMSNELVFRGEMDGLMIEQVIREKEYSMVSRHIHTTYELYYLLEGERFYFIDNETYLVKAGDVVMIRPSHIHKTSQSGNMRHNRLLLQIGSSIDPFLKACGMGGLDDLFGNDARIISLSESLRLDVLRSFMRIREELFQKQRHYQTAVRLELADMLLKLDRYQAPDGIGNENQTVQTWKHVKVHEVADYLTVHPETSDSLKDLARKFYISRTYLSRIFKEVTGFTVNEYKNISRIRKSQALLTHSDWSVTEISDRLGFENLTYFEKVFKKYADTTPLKYRRQFRNAAGGGDPR